MTFKIFGKRYKLTQEGEKLLNTITTIALLGALLIGCLLLVGYFNYELKMAGMPEWMWAMD